jgi:hypothetical protein
MEGLTRPRFGCRYVTKGGKSATLHHNPLYFCRTELKKKYPNGPPEPSPASPSSANAAAPLRSSGHRVTYVNGVHEAPEPEVRPAGSVSRKLERSRA